MKRACLNCQHEFDTLPGSVCPDDGGMLIPLKADAQIGTVLDNKYEILEVLGGGGMGMVYKARHKLMNRVVAIKMLHKFLVSTGEAMRRFQNEAQVASCLKHPNILTVYDFGVNEDGQPFMVMDYLEGFSLCELLDQEGHLSVERALNIFIQTCAGFSHAHENGVLHRDLKPSNIMLINVEDEHDFVKIVDFGVAKILSNGPAAEKSGADRPGLKVQLTKTGEVFGSPLYMSPEQCRAKETDQRSDVYAMGCLIYRSLTGVPVFTGTELLELLLHQISDTPEPFSVACEHFNGTSEIEQIAFKAMAKNPNDRYQSMSELGRALKALQAKLPNKFDAPLQIETHERSSEESEANALLADLKSVSEPKNEAATMAENFSPEPLRQPRIGALAPSPPKRTSIDTADGLAVVDASHSIHFAVGLRSEEPVMASLQSHPEAQLLEYKNPPPLRQESPSTELANLLTARSEAPAVEIGSKALAQPTTSSPYVEGTPLSRPTSPPEKMLSARSASPSTNSTSSSPSPLGSARSNPAKAPLAQTELAPQALVKPAISPPEETPLDRSNKSIALGEGRNRRSASTEARRMKEVLRENWHASKLAVTVAIIFGTAVLVGASIALMQPRYALKPQSASADRFDSSNFDKQYKASLELCRQNKFIEAIQVVTGAVAEARKIGAPGLDLSNALSLRAKAYLDSGNFQKSESDARTALAACRAAKGENSLAYASCQSELARVLLSGAHFSEADPLLRKAIATETQLNAPNEQKSTTLLNLAICEMKQNNKADAKGDLRKAIALMPPDAARNLEIKHEFQDLIDSKGGDDDSGKVGVAPAEHSRNHVAAASHTATPAPRRHAYSTYGY